MKFTIEITRSLLDNFVEFTSDRNSFHTNSEIARKSRFRDIVVHGMLPYSYIGLLAAEFPDCNVRFKKLSAEFIKPLFIGDKVDFEIGFSLIDKNLYEFKALLRKRPSGEEVTKGRGTFETLPKIKVPQERNETSCIILDDIKENVYQINDLKEGISEEFKFNINSKIKKRFLTLLLFDCKRYIKKIEKNEIDLCNNFISSLFISTMVGMKIPGRYATLQSFSLTFTGYINNGTNEIRGILTKLFPSINKLRLKINIIHDSQNLCEGEVRSYINPKPREVIKVKEIKSKYADLGLKGKVALITGASRGIGAATAKLLGTLGTSVAVNYYKGKNDAEKIVDDINKAKGNSIAIFADISKQDNVREMIDKTVDFFGTIDILVNCAVYEFSIKDTLELTWEDYLKELNVSLRGLHNCCKAVIPYFKEKKSGKIITMSSILVELPIKGQNKYITVKSALTGYTRSLAKELAEDNIQVNMVVPGMTETDLLAEIPQKYIEKLAQEKPLGRNILPIEVAQTISFLASDWSKAISGQRIIINAGETPFL